MLQCRLYSPDTSVTVLHSAVSCCCLPPVKLHHFSSFKLTYLLIQQLVNLVPTQPLNIAAIKKKNVATLQSFHTLFFMCALDLLTFCLLREISIASGRLPCFSKDSFSPVITGVHVWCSQRSQLVFMPMILRVVVRRSRSAWFSENYSKD